MTELAVANMVLVIQILIYHQFLIPIYANMVILVSTNFDKV